MVAYTLGATRSALPNPTRDAQLSPEDLLSSPPPLPTGGADYGVQRLARH